MAHRGHGGIMLLGRHPHGLGADRSPEFLRGVERLGGRVLGGRKNSDAILEQVGLGVLGNLSLALRVGCAAVSGAVRPPGGGAPAAAGGSGPVISTWVPQASIGLVATAQFKPGVSMPVFVDLSSPQAVIPITADVSQIALVAFDDEDEPAGEHFLGKGLLQELVAADAVAAGGQEVDVVVVGAVVPGGREQGEGDPGEQPEGASGPRVSSGEPPERFEHARRFPRP